MAKTWDEEETRRFILDYQIVPVSCLMEEELSLLREAPATNHDTMLYILHAASAVAFYDELL
jgi:hypothetical protein